MSSEHLEALLAAVRGQPYLLILPHNDPDPDAIASALALRYLLVDQLKIEAQVGYKGIIGRAENRSLVRYLNHPLHHLTEADLTPATPVALVDTQPGTGNNPWLPELDVRIVLDHHPWLENSKVAAFADVRPEMGATSTLLFDYLMAAGVELSSSLATALFYGIKTDTRGLSRGISSSDAAAYFHLQARIDGEALAEIERAQVPAAYFKSFAATLKATQVYDGIAISYIGSMEYPDLAAELADLLSRLEKIEWVICLGTFDENLLMSVRTPNEKGGAGRLVRFVVNGEGTAGGHGVMAGGQIPLKNRNPEMVVRQLNRRILQYFSLDPETVGYRLV